MMKNILIALFLLGFILSSCSSYIGPPMAGSNNIGYLPRPFVTDDPKSETYFSGEFSSGSSIDYDNKINSGIVNISRGYSNNKFNIGFGGFGFLGKAKYKNDFNDLNNSGIDDPIQVDISNNFSGWGLRSTIGFHKISSNKRVNFRLVNWENAYSQEYGDYTEFRNNITTDDIPNENPDGLGRIYSSNFRKIYTTGLSSEIIYNETFKDKNTMVGIRTFVGFSPRLGNSFSTIFEKRPYEDDIRSLIFSGSIHFRHENLIGTVQSGVGDKLFSFKIGIGYSF